MFVGGEDDDEAGEDRGRIDEVTVGDLDVGGLSGGDRIVWDFVICSLIGSFLEDRFSCLIR